MMMDPDILKLFSFGHKPDPEGLFPAITMMIWTPTTAPY